MEVLVTASHLLCSKSMEDMKSSFGKWNVMHTDVKQSANLDCGSKV
jgi:hypothetical protein